MIKNREEIVKTLENGGVIAYVTDTVWGLGCLPENESAVKKIYDIKKREAQKPLILMSNEVYNLLDYVKPIPKVGQILIKKYFPGALTIVTYKSDRTPDYITSGMEFRIMMFSVKFVKLFQIMCLRQQVQIYPISLLPKLMSKHWETCQDLRI